MAVSSRRFDTDAVLQHIMEGDKSAFEAFYERYRGRIYRFIARQYGTGDFGKAAYYSAWRCLIISSRTSKSPKELKFSFFKNLGKSSQNDFQNKYSDSHASYLPKDIEADGKWSVVFIEQFRRLPEPMKKRFLFKHEIGLSPTAIARILDDKRKHIEKSIEEAERMLRLHMDEAGCPDRFSLDKLYRDSRVVKPPASWNNEILDSFEIWLKQTELPNDAHSETEDEQQEAKAGFGEMLNDWIATFKQRTHKLRAGTKSRKPRITPSRR